MARNLSVVKGDCRALDTCSKEGHTAEEEGRQKRQTDEAGRRLLVS